MPQPAPNMSSRLALFALCLGAALLCGSCGDRSSQPGVQVPDISPKTEAEFAQAIDTMRDAWRARPREISEENGKAEQRFMTRFVSLANHTKGTGNFKATKLLWREIFTEHSNDYPTAK